MLEIFFNNLTQIVGTILFLVFLFVLAREFFLWYFKINQHIENQNRTVFLLEKLLEKSPRSSISTHPVVEEVSEERPNIETSPKKDFEPKRCTQCNKVITSNFPIIINEHGKTKYFCTDDCRLNNLEI
jgi:hypothetical protein